VRVGDMTKGDAICVIGQHDPEYPRNVANQRSMRAAGYDVLVCRSRAAGIIRTWSLLVQYLRQHGRVRVVFATEGAHRHIPLLRLATVLTGKTLVFDPFISLYNTEVEDRRLHAKFSFRALLAWWRDWSGCFFADYLVFDTIEHRDYFFERYRIRRPWSVIPVGVDEQVFYPRLRPGKPAGSRREILFYGTYIPLQGIEVIVRAAELLRDDPRVAFTLIGDGQEYPRIRALVDSLALPNLRLKQPTTPDDLAKHVADADICLGIFDGGAKAGRVVPNKVVQCAAMGKAIVTRESSAMARYFSHGRDVWCVPPNDPAALAQAIVQLTLDPVLVASLGLGSRSAFERHFSAAARMPLMRGVLIRAEEQAG
jgi:glycosyltransferase involved in cell wall biosynthesis